MQHHLITLLITSTVFAQVLSPMGLHAGTDVPATIPSGTSPVFASADPDGWKITAWCYGWLAGIEGTSGVKGFTTDVDVPFSSILDHLDMTAALNIEAQKGRWGGWIDGMYLKVSAGGNTPDPLLQSVNLSVEQLLVEAAMFYRVWEGERGWMDLYGGARYMSVKGDIDLQLSDAGVARMSDQLGSRVVDEITRRVKTRAVEVLEAKKEEISSQIAAQAGAVLEDLKAVGEAHPGLVATIKQSERLQQAIRDAAAARVEEKMATAREAAVEARSAAKKAVVRAEKALTREIERALRESIPTSLSGSKDWVDPFVGVRGCFHFNERFYLVGKADVGGFGVSSDLAWQTYAALGCHLNKRTVLELWIVGAAVVAVKEDERGLHEWRVHQ